MHARLPCLLALLVFASSPSVSAQSLEADGTVTEISGDRIIVEVDPSISIADGATGRVFVSKQMGNEEQQDIVAGVLRVETVSGPLIVGRLTDRSRLVDVAEGQHVSFQTGRTPGDVGGTLSVQTTPSDATVLLADAGTAESPQVLGVTPVRDSVATGRYDVRVTKDGYQSVMRTIRIRPGADRTLEIPLKRRAGVLSVRPTPDTASVFVDGERWGTGQIRDSVTAGKHAVRVEAAGYVTERDTVRVASAATRVVRPSLERSTGTVKVRSTPAGAVFYLDGTKRGNTPVTKKLEAGRHAIQVTKGGYDVVTDTIQIRRGAVRTIDVDLKRPLDVKMARPRGPVKGSTLQRVESELHIHYALSGPEKRYDVDLQFSHDGGQSFRTIDQSKLQGDVGDEISPGTNKEIRWDALQDFPKGIFGDGYQLRVRAEAPVSGEFTIEVQAPPGDFGFGGGRIGWSTENGFIGGSYTQLGQGVDVVSVRAMPHWTVGGFLTYRTILGLAYIDGVPSALSGGMELGTGLHIGTSVYVGGDVLYLQTLAGQGEVGLVLSLGVAL